MSSLIVKTNSVTRSEGGVSIVKEGRREGREIITSAQVPKDWCNTIGPLSWKEGSFERVV
jgi:hypothetical protein